MGVLKSTALLISLIGLIGGATSDELESSTDSKRPVAPSIEIGVQVVPSSSKQKNADLQTNQEFLVLVDTWWKILAWTLACLTLSCLCCYFSRCCYLCWDCCSDPFWGCCPQSQRCHNFLLMKGGCCARRKRGKSKTNLDYQPCIDVEIAKVEADLSADEEDFTLRTVESLEVDAMLNHFSPIKGRAVTSTPRKKATTTAKKKTQEPQETDSFLLELSGEAESLPQLYPTHYFNILNLFGVGCSNYKVSEHHDHHKKYMIPMTSNTTNNSSGCKSLTVNEDSTIGLITDNDEDFVEDRSFDRSVIHNQDFPLSSSFSNMYKKNGLHIEEGRRGRYY